jgi:hypothetical protein
VSPRTRILAFGTAAAVAIAGGICGAVIHGLIGQLLAFVLISFGLGGAVLLVFLEVGLSEDRDRARAQARAQARASERPARATKPRQRPQPPRWPRRPG